MTTLVGSMTAMEASMTIPPQVLSALKPTLATSLKYERLEKWLLDMQLSLRFQKETQETQLYSLRKFAESADWMPSATQQKIMTMARMPYLNSQTQMVYCNIPNILKQSGEVLLSSTTNHTLSMVLGGDPFGSMWRCLLPIVEMIPKIEFRFMKVPKFSDFPESIEFCFIYKSRTILDEFEQIDKQYGNIGLIKTICYNLLPYLLLLNLQRTRIHRDHQIRCCIDSFMTQNGSYGYRISHGTNTFHLVLNIEHRSMYFTVAELGDLERAFIQLISDGIRCVELGMSIYNAKELDDFYLDVVNNLNKINKYLRHKMPQTMKWSETSSLVLSLVIQHYPECLNHPDIRITKLGSRVCKTLLGMAKKDKVKLSFDLVRFKVTKRVNYTVGFHNSMITEILLLIHSYNECVVVRAIDSQDYKLDKLSTISLVLRYNSHLRGVCYEPCGLCTAFRSGFKLINDLTCVINDSRKITYQYHLYPGPFCKANDLKVTDLPPIERALVTRIPRLNSIEEFNSPFAPRLEAATSGVIQVYLGGDTSSDSDDSSHDWSID